MINHQSEMFFEALLFKERVKDDMFIHFNRQDWNHPNSYV